MFDSASFDSVRKPLLAASTLPRFCYVDSEFYDLEQKSVFWRTWNFVGHSSSIPNPGDYFTWDLLNVPIIVAHGESGQLRAFSNSCSHKGTRLIDGRGHTNLFTCPYHSWAYGLDGGLRRAPHMEFCENFDKAEHGLNSLRLEVWAGFIFVTFDDQASPLSQHISKFSDLFSGYPLEDLVCTRQKTFDAACNWKIISENFLEMYHTPYVHNRSFASMKDRTPSLRYANENRSEIFGELPGSPVQIWNGSNGAAFVLKHAGSSAVIPPDPGFPPMEGRRGKAAESGSIFATLYPNTLIATLNDAAWYMQMDPVGPTQTRFTVGSLFHKQTVARPDFAELAPNYYKRVDIVGGEDVGICERQQQGLTSPFVSVGRVCHLERLTQDFRVWLVNTIEANIKKADRGDAAGRS